MYDLIVGFVCDDPEELYNEIAEKICCDEMDDLGDGGSVSVDAQVSVHEIRNAIADYMYSEGCSCCRDIDKHEINTKRIAELLNVPMYDDSSGYDFSWFRSAR